jgi:LytS/YehU family sensor histidine kinase
MIAPLIFISLIENAFKHGISLTVPSFIHIDMTASDKEITCRIENSNHPKSLEDRSGHGIGLNQVERRLELAYPNHYIWEKGLSDDGKSYLSIIKIKL